MTREVKALKETVGSLGLQASPDPWASVARKDQRGKKAAWEILAWKDPWAREGEKAPWDLVVNQGHLGSERKGREALLVNQVLTGPPVSRVLWVPKVPVALLALRGPQVP